MIKLKQIKLKWILFISIFILLFSVIMTSGYLYETKLINDRIKSLNLKMTKMIIEVKKTFDTRIDFINYNTSSIKNLVIDKYYNINSQKIKITLDIKNMLNPSLGVYEVKIIDKSGQEIIKVNKNKEELNIVPSYELEDKNSRYYVKNGFDSPYNEIVYSNLDLNIEYGKIRKPYRYTLRTIMKFKNLNEDYLLIVNYNMTHLFTNILYTTLYDVFLIEDDGQINIHNDSQYAFSKQLEKNKYIYDIYNLEKHNIESLELEFGYYTMVITPKISILNNIYSARDNAFFVWFFTTVLIGIILSIIILYFFNRLFKRLNNGIKDIISGVKIDKKKEFYELNIIYNDVKKVYRDVLQNKQKLYKKELEHTIDKQDLQNNIIILENENRLKSINKIIASSSNTKELCDNTLEYFSSISSIIMATIYTKDLSSNNLNLISSYAKDSSIVKDNLDLDTTLTGECYKRKQIKILNFDTPLLLSELHIIPLIYKEKIVAIMEIYFVSKQSKDQQELMKLILNTFVINLKIHLDSDQMFKSQEVFFDNINDLVKSQHDFIEQNVIFTETDLKGIITKVSDAYLEFSGYSRDELIRQPHNIVRHPDMPSGAFKLMWKTIQEGQTFRFDVKNKKKDGSYYWAKSIVSPIFKNNKIIGYRAIRFDITKQKDFEARLEKETKYV